MRERSFSIKTLKGLGQEFETAYMAQDLATSKP